MLQQKEDRVREAHLHDIITASRFLIDRLQDASLEPMVTIDRQIAEEWHRLLATMIDIAPSEVSSLQTSLAAWSQDAGGGAAVVSPNAMVKATT